MARERLTAEPHARMAVPVDGEPLCRRAGREGGRSVIALDRLDSV